jgi:type II secretory pathway pseudopilin PulG
MLNDHQFSKCQLPSLIQRTQLLKLLRTSIRSDEAEQGLTLIEGLLAIVIIAITVVSITPPVFWAVASRVQTQRAEQALKIAQGEIDRVRTLVERDETANAQFTDNLLPPFPANATETDVRNQNSGKFPGAPSKPKSASQVRSIRDCGTGANDDGKASSTANGFDEFIQVDTNGDCAADYLVQTFRSQGLDEAGNQFRGQTEQKLAAFVMGVRVYAAIARPALTSGKGRTEPASLKGTNGVGNQLDRPLAVMYSTIIRSADSANLDLYRQLCSDRTTGAC